MATADARYRVWVLNADCDVDSVAKFSSEREMSALDKSKATKPLSQAALLCYQFRLYIGGEWR